MMLKSKSGYIFALQCIVRKGVPAPPFLRHPALHSVLPPWDQGGMIFVSSARQGGQLLNFKSQGGETFRGGDDFRQSSRGGTALL